MFEMYSIVQYCIIPLKQPVTTNSHGIKLQESVLERRPVIMDDAKAAADGILDSLRQLVMLGVKTLGEMVD